MCEAAAVTVNILGVEPCEKSIYQIRDMASVFADLYEEFKQNPEYGVNSERFKAWKAERARKEALR